MHDDHYWKSCLVQPIIKVLIRRLLCAANELLRTAYDNFNDPYSWYCYRA